MEALPSEQSVAEKQVLVIAIEESEEQMTGWYLIKVASSSSSSSRSSSPMSLPPADRDNGGKKKKMKLMCEEIDNDDEEESDEDDDKDSLEEEDLVTHPRLSPIRVLTSEKLSTYCHIGSTLYRIGGSTPDVLAADTEHIIDGELEWKLPRMRVVRENPSAVVVDGKLYVFGGIFAQRFRPFAEVFDPKEKYWNSLPPPPPEHIGSYPELFTLHDPESSLFKSKIIVGCSTSDSLLAYNIDSNAWEKIAEIFEFPTAVTSPVLYKDWLYWIAEKVWAYDLRLKKMFEGPIIGDFDETMLYTPNYMWYRPPLFHIDGDEFCCIWIDDLGIKGDLQVISCTTIEILKTMYKKKVGVRSVKARTLGTKSYLVDQPIKSLTGVVMDGKFSCATIG